jgi:hypothetical protein
MKSFAAFAGSQNSSKKNSGVCAELVRAAFVDGVHLHAIDLIAVFGLHRDGVTLANQVRFVSGEAEGQSVGDKLRLRPAEAGKASRTRDLSSIDEIKLKNWHAGNTPEGNIGFVDRLQKIGAAIKHPNAVIFTEKT